MCTPIWYRSSPIEAKDTVLWRASRTLELLYNCNLFLAFLCSKFSLYEVSLAVQLLSNPLILDLSFGKVSQYTFAICSYKEKKSDPSEMMQLDGYTVDYIEPAGGNGHTWQLDNETKMTFFNSRNIWPDQGTTLWSTFAMDFAFRMLDKILQKIL